MRFVESGLSVAIACNSDYSKPGDLAQRVADHYLADELGPESSDEEAGTDQQGADVPAEPPSLSSLELAGFAGGFFSAELDATYRFAVVDGSLMVRIEQEPSLQVTPVDDDKFEIRFYDQGWPGPQTASLAFDRNPSGAVTGFGLSSGTERDIVFEMHH